MAKSKDNASKAAPIRIGEKVRQLRRLKGLQLKELASLVGCSESMLSKVETNKVNPSFTTLSKLIQVLRTDVDYLFSADETLELPVSRPGQRPIISFDQLGRGRGIRLERLVPYSREHLLQANIHIVSARGVREGLIRHTGEEVGYVLEGELDLMIGGETYRLSAGDSFHFRSEIPHGYRNPGRTTTRVLWINTPPSYYIRPITEKTKGPQSPADGDPRL